MHAMQHAMDESHDAIGSGWCSKASEIAIGSFLRILALRGWFVWHGTKWMSRTSYKRSVAVPSPQKRQRAQNSRILSEIVLWPTLKSCRRLKQGIAMLPAL